jgi:hypothetical protein
MTMPTTNPATRIQFDDLLDIAAANDVERRSPDDPVASVALVRAFATVSAAPRSLGRLAVAGAA